MREWQIGDPIGDGNDIGVPDIPYLDYLKENEEPSYDIDNMSLDGALDILLRRVYVEEQRKEDIKRELKRFLMAKGALLTDVTYDIGQTNFTITRKNRYFETKDIFYFINEYYNPCRVFEDSVTIHNYDGLLNNPKFQSQIERRESETGMKFSGCGGGYLSTYRLYDNKFDLLDKCSVVAHFILDDDNTAGYEIDFDNLSLSENYTRYPRR